MRHENIVSAEDIRNTLERMRLLDVSEAACATYGTSLRDAFAGCHRPRFARSRAMVWGILRHFAGLSYPEIGALTGYDPTTIRSQIRTHCPHWSEAAPRKRSILEAPVTWTAKDVAPIGLGTLEGML